MKLRALLLVLVFALLSGCASVLNTPQPATPTPEIMPRLDPSPTPSHSTLPLTCQVTDLNVYINEADGYCFAYPRRFTLGDQPSDKPDVRGPAIGSSAEPVYATFSVDVTPATEKTLQEQAETFLRDFSVMDPATFNWTEVQVGGEPGLMIEPVPVQLSWRIIFIQHNRRLFRLSYWPVDVPEAKADLDELTQTTVGSFAFLK
jgi:hypothetical protein